MNMVNVDHPIPPQSHGKIDTVEGFIDELNRVNLKGEDKYLAVSSLRVALTNNPVRWVDGLGSGTRYERFSLNGSLIIM